MDIFLCIHIFFLNGTPMVLLLIRGIGCMWVFLKMKSESVGIVHFVKAGNGNSTLIVSMYTNEWNSTYINMFWTDTHIGTVLKKWSVIIRVGRPRGLPNFRTFEHFGTSLPNCLRTVRRPLLYYKEGEHLVIFCWKWIV